MLYCYTCNIVVRTAFMYVFTVTPLVLTVFSLLLLYVVKH